MENWTFKEQEYEFWTKTGVVLSQAKYSETHVSGGGGGGSHGNTSAVSISSHASTNQEFWIKTDKGEEISYQFSNSDIPLREGQRISIIYIKNIDVDSGYAAVLVNHNSNEWYYLLEIPNFTNKSIMPYKNWWKIVVYGAALVFAFFGYIFLGADAPIVAGCSGSLWLFFVGPFIALIVVEPHMNKSNLKSINSHLATLARECLKNEK